MLQTSSETMPLTWEGFREAAAVAIADHSIDINFDDVLAKNLGNKTNQDYQVHKCRFLNMS